MEQRPTGRGRARGRGRGAGNEGSQQRPGGPGPSSQSSAPAPQWPARPQQQVRTPAQQPPHHGLVSKCIFPS